MGKKQKKGTLQASTAERQPIQAQRQLAETQEQAGAAERSIETQEQLPEAAAVGLPVGIRGQPDGAEELAEAPRRPARRKRKQKKKEPLGGFDELPEAPRQRDEVDELARAMEHLGQELLEIAAATQRRLAKGKQKMKRPQGQATVAGSSAEDFLELPGPSMQPDVAECLTQAGGQAAALQRQFGGRRPHGVGRLESIEELSEDPSQQQLARDEQERVRPQGLARTKAPMQRGVAERQRQAQKIAAIVQRHFSGSKKKMKTANGQAIPVRSSVQASQELPGTSRQSDIAEHSWQAQEESDKIWQRLVAEKKMQELQEQAGAVGSSTEAPEEVSVPQARQDVAEEMLRALVQAHKLEQHAVKISQKRKRPKELVEVAGSSAPMQPVVGGRQAQEQAVALRQRGPQGVSRSRVPSAALRRYPFEARMPPGGTETLDPPMGVLPTIVCATAEQRAREARDQAELAAFIARIPRTRPFMTFRERRDRLVAMFSEFKKLQIIAMQLVCRFVQREPLRSPEEREFDRQFHEFRLILREIDRCLASLKIEEAGTQATTIYRKIPREEHVLFKCFAMKLMWLHHYFERGVTNQNIYVYLHLGGVKKGDAKATYACTDITYTSTGTDSDNDEPQIPRPFNPRERRK